MPLLGAHESVAGGLHLAFDRLHQVGGEALQIFTRNQRQWHPQPLTQEEIDLFQTARQQNNNPPVGRSLSVHGAIDTWASMPVASHASYLINLASGKQELVEKSIAAFGAEIHRCEQLGIPFVIIHPGSHGGDGVEEGVARFTRALDLALEETGAGVTVLLETTAGQGTSLGSRFEELAFVLEHSGYPQRLGVCVDTCHIFAAGYDIGTRPAYTQTMAEFDRLVGIERIKFFHLNDSKQQLASRVDRHEHIGQGAIGLDGFRSLLNDPRFTDHPMTLETPKGDDLQEDRDNLLTLHGLIEKLSTPRHK
ncbi:MAG: deoxyribonuclease IV [Desulfocapsaceae bacterium]|nr:deoxyribonuclease IV [Desulfocapsaceae bacterium]